MIIKRIPAGVYAANCYIIMDDDSKETVVIDPGGDSDDIISCIRELNCTVKYILLTHAHADHTGGIDDIRKLFNVPVCVNERDKKMIKDKAFMFGSYKEDKEKDIDIKDGDIFKIGKIEIKCMETPGHTPGGMCFLLNDVVLTGDTLFAGSVGRTDFAGGDYDAIIRSIRVKLMVLDDNIKVLPGHGMQSTIGRERMSNPFL